MAFNAKAHEATLKRLETHPRVIKFADMGRRVAIMSALVEEAALWHKGDKCQNSECGEPSTVRVSDGNPFGFKYLCETHGEETYAKVTSPTWGGY